jgi:hypothetical protein
LEVLPFLSYRPAHCCLLSMLRVLLSLSLLRVTHLLSDSQFYFLLLMLPSPGGPYLLLLLSCC